MFVGFIADETGSYDIPFFLTGSVEVLGSVLLFIVAYRRNKRLKAEQLLKDLQVETNQDKTQPLELKDINSKSDDTTYQEKKNISV